MTVGSKEKKTSTERNYNTALFGETTLEVLCHIVRLIQAVGDYKVRGTNTKAAKLIWKVSKASKQYVKAAIDTNNVMDTEDATSNAVAVDTNHETTPSRSTGTRNKITKYGKLEQSLRNNQNFLAISEKEKESSIIINNNIKDSHKNISDSNPEYLRAYFISKDNSQLPDDLNDEAKCKLQSDTLIVLTPILITINNINYVFIPTHEPNTIVTNEIIFEAIKCLKSFAHTDLENYYDLYDNFIFSYKKMVELCDLRDSQKEYLKPCIMAKSLFNRISRVLHRVQNNNSIIGEILNSQQFLNRNKRGLANAVGNVAKVLFGTLDENDA
ncbi:unnamed protein product [Ceutorhynchus assimilis]|uniref:Uncharacterized protein n=1 Tax=Ceutorhynchus assimilis TaxID=467358 RepID=A0A9N9MU35_9CUCU|nr:unnamed protein product [Ceutorhynchus assimilis]